MKYILLICTFISINALSLDRSLDIDIKAAIADTKYDPYEYDFSNKKKIFQFLEYKEPPTKAQYTYFYFIHALDVITTYEGLKSNPNVKEQNIFFTNNKRPSLGELVLFKAIMLPLLGNNIDYQTMEVLNITTTLVVIHNYEIYN